MEGNYKTLRRMRMLRRILRDMGIEDDRFRLEWISASEGDRVRSVINDMVAKVQALGPLALPGRRAEALAGEEELADAL
jgi:F420-non-reducing hydrogenase iron-sulfur subunit